MGIESYVKLNIRTAIHFFLILLGILFYFSWGFAYGGWFDIGVYSITVLLIGFGLVGIFLYSVMDEEEE